MLKNILVLILTVFVMVVIGELILQLFFPIDDPYANIKMGVADKDRYIESQFMPNQKYMLYPEPGLPGMAAEVRFSTNNMGFRGGDLLMPKPEGEFRVFMVGGSTTECLYLDDTCAVTHVLETYLNAGIETSTTIKVYNAGKSGDRSYDHIAMISQRLVHLDPDMIILFCGMNDLTAAIYDADYTHLPISGRQRLSFGDLTKYLLTEFQLPRRLFYLYRRLARPDEETTVLTVIPIHSDYKRKVVYRKSQSATDSRPRIDIAPYRNNLTTIAGLARIHAISLVFMTQATTWNSAIDPDISDRHWATFRNGVTYREEAMDRAMSAYNDALRDVGQEHNIPVFETDFLLPKSREFFYDDCHFNIQGARKAADLLGRFLIENGLIGS